MKCAICDAPATLQPIIVCRAVKDGTPANLIPQLGICDGHSGITPDELLPLGMFDALAPQLSEVCGAPIDRALTEVRATALDAEIVFD